MPFFALEYILSLQDNDVVILRCEMEVKIKNAVGLPLGWFDVGVNWLFWN